MRHCEFPTGKQKARPEASGPACDVRFTANARMATSYGATLRYGAQTPFSDQLAFHWAGSEWEYDAQHNSLLTAGNGGTKPIHVGLTVFYNDGAGRYEVEQTLQPDEQAWVDIGKLIREQVPDQNGKTLPADLTSGSFEWRDLTNGDIGRLFEGKIIYDKTYGHVTYGCAICCGYANAQLDFDPFEIPYLGTVSQGANSLDTCKSGYVETGSYFYNNWATGNTSVATVDANGRHTGVAVGATSTNTHAYLQAVGRYGGMCPIKFYSPSGRDNVIQLQLQGNPFSSIFVGTDPNLSAANSIFATVSPSGGTFTEASSVSGDTFTPVTSAGPGWVVGTTIQSSSTADRKLTVTYAVSGQGQVSKSLNVTARQFAYLTNNTPSNTCAGYGTYQVYIYTPYTHPDGAAVQPGIGVDGTLVAESFSPPPPPGAVTGNGALDANSQFTDTLAYCSNSPITISATITQTLSIEGYQVRQNTLNYSSTGITYTSLAPTQ